ncbi:MAG: hypothetical protein DMF94_34145 [Acidobacteria bacterium]|nr:MAG: hypothetical protein DMF94_34145 [Acidobacteriota bacterium]
MASVAVNACCYTLRPLIAQTRLRVDAEGQVWITLRHQWSDGTTHLRFDQVALLERLAVLIPTSIELASAVALQAMEEHRSAGIEWACVVTRGRSMSA